MANDITTIGIRVSANTKRAENNLVSLTTKLSALSTAFNQLTFATTQIRGITDALVSLNTIKGTSLSKTIPERLTALGQSLFTVDVNRLHMIADGLRDIAAAGSVAIPMIKLSGMGVPGGSAVPGTAPELPDVDTASVTSTSDALDRIKASAEEASQAMDKVKRKADDMGKSMRKASGAVSGTTSKLGQLWAAMKRIATYRAIRSAIRAITDGFRTGIQNLYQFSALTNGEFKQSMDSLATSALYLKNSLGALVAPIINALAPAIDILVDKFVDLLNLINRFFARITGASYWTKAKKYPKEYAEALDGANGSAKELRATLLGFDEINRLDDMTKGGRGSSAQVLDYDEMFEEVELTKKTFSEMWDDLLESGNSKFALFAGGLASVLALKLGGAMNGVFGTGASTSLLGGFTAVLLATFGGFSLGNWLYHNVPGIRNWADDLMDNGMGEFIDNVIEGYGYLEDYAIEWGDKILDAGEDAWNEFQSWLGMNDTTTLTVYVNDEDARRQIQEYLDYVASLPVVVNPNTNNTADPGGYNPYLDTPPKQNTNNTGDPGGYNPNFDPGYDSKKPGITSIVNSTIDALEKIKKQTTKAISLKAGGGSVATGDLFLANERGPELIAKVGSKTQVANNDQITESIRVATAQGNAESNMLLREVVGICQALLAKDTTVVAEVTTDSITSGLARQNRRNGRTVVPVGG